MEARIPESSRLFSHHEANHLVPMLQLSFAAISELRVLAEEILADLSGGDPLQVAGILRGDIPPEPEEVERVDRLQEIIEEIGSAVGHLTERGLVIQELDPGVVDFPSVVEGEVVMLCWQYGEASVEYFHHLEGEFEERAPLPDSHPILS